MSTRMSAVAESLLPAKSHAPPSDFIPPKLVTARSLVRKMKGGSQSHLLKADDGSHYVVKFKNNPQHRRILINELLGSMVLRYLGIAVPTPAIVSIPPDFLAENPDVYFQLGTRRVPAGYGFGFGSLFPGDPNAVAVYDFLPVPMLGKLANLIDFLGVFVFDKWMANTDRRQAIYFRGRVRDQASIHRPHSRHIRLVAQMIDHGNIFDGGEWRFCRCDSPLHGLAACRAVYENAKSLDDFQPWLDSVIGFPEEVLRGIRRTIPEEWIEDDEGGLDALLEKLLRRRSSVPSLLRECAVFQGRLMLSQSHTFVPQLAPAIIEKLLPLPLYGKSLPTLQPWTVRIHQPRGLRHEVSDREPEVLLSLPRALHRDLTVVPLDTSLASL